MPACRARACARTPPSPGLGSPEPHTHRPRSGQSAIAPSRGTSAVAPATFMRSAFGPRSASSRKARTPCSRHPQRSSPRQPQARQPQIGQCEQPQQMRRVLPQRAESQLHQVEPRLDHPERMFDPRSYARLAALDRQGSAEPFEASAGDGWPARESSAQALASSKPSPDLRRTESAGWPVRNGLVQTFAKGSIRRGARGSAPRPRPARSC